MRLWYRISQALTGNCFTRAHKWCPWIEQAYKDALLSTCSTTKTRENQRVTFSNQHSECERATCSKTYLRFKARSHSLMHVSVTTGRAEKFDGLALAKVFIHISPYITNKGMIRPNGIRFLNLKRNNFGLWLSRKDTEICICLFNSTWMIDTEM